MVQVVGIGDGSRVVNQNMQFLLSLEERLRRSLYAREVTQVDLQEGCLTRELEFVAELADHRFRLVTVPACKVNLGVVRKKGLPMTLP